MNEPGFKPFNKHKHVNGDLNNIYFRNCVE
jgi:hypothetical protein